MSDDPRPPLVFVDVDGVVNALGNSHGVLPPNCADLFGTVEVPAGFGETLTVRFRPDVIDRLRALSDSGAADFVWLTTWRHTAREQLAPLIGLPDWPAIPHLVDDGGDRDVFSAHQWDPERRWWKLQALLDRTADGRSFAWLDDDVASETKRIVCQLRPQPSLLITPPTSIGLTNQLVMQLEYFCGVEREDDESSRLPNTCR